jgi:hypothetical protein
MICCQAPCNQDQFCNAIKREGIYRCAGNFFWMDQLISATPGVPLNLKRVRDLAAATFSAGPQHVPWTFHIAVESADYDVLGNKGKLFRISPEETAHALLLRMAQDLGDPNINDVLLRWRHVCLTVPFIFERVPKHEDVLWKSNALRQTLTIEYAGMKRTARQSAHDIFLMKRRVESDDPTANLATISSILMDKANKEFTENYIASALRVYDNVCSIPAIVSCLDKLENQYGLDSCLNSMAKLYDVTRLCEDSEVRIWIFECIVDAIEAKMYRNDDISKAFLIGSKHQVGLVPLLHFKRRCLHYYLNISLPKAGFDHTDLQIIRNNLANPNMYRMKVASLFGDCAPDQAWVGKLKLSSQCVLRLVEVRLTT